MATSFSPIRSASATKVRKGGGSPSSTSEEYRQSLPSGVVLRRFALFVDGMARAMILPFGPTLVYRLINTGTNGALAADNVVTPTGWSSISFQLALVIAAFMVGHTAGSLVAEKLSVSNQKLHTYVARLGGAAISLHIFSCGAGLSSVFWLVAIRFWSAVVVGILCGITDASSLPEDSTVTTTTHNDTHDRLQQKMMVDPSSNIASGTAKIYLTGFAVSILTGGLFYRPASANDIVQALTGSYSYTWSPLFLVASTIVGEIVLRGAFALTTQPEHLDRTSGNIRKVRKIVRRVVGGKQRVSFKEVPVDPESLRLLGGGGGGSVMMDPLRPRSSTAGSAMTDMDEFYDCQSEFSDGMSTSKPIYNNDYDDRDYKDEIAHYENGKCCYSDGSPAYVPPGDTAAIVPSNYIEECKGDRGKALKMWQETQRWRREQNVWKIHTLPHQFFYDIKRCYPHFMHGYSKAGLPVVYEQPGKMNLKALFSAGCTIDDMVHHYIFFQEFVSRCCASKELRQIAGKEYEPYSSSSYGNIVVCDIQGAGISMLSTDVLRYLKRAGDVVGAHYPFSLKTCCVTNVPFWASGAYRIIKSVLPDSVVFDLMSEADSLQRLQQYIDIDQIPPEYGGTSPYKLGEHPNEIKLRGLVDRLARGDVEAMEEPLIVSSTPADMVDINIGDSSTPRKEMPSRSINDLASDKHMRRRTVGPALESRASDDNGGVYSINNGGVGVDSLAFISFFCAFWSGAQGGIEIAIPLWLSSPIVLGGLGYSPSMSGVTMSFAALALFGMLTTRASRLISHVPRKDPLRALRIGLAAESICLFLLAFAPIFFSVEENPTIILASTVFLLSLGTLASILGRSSSTILRGLVSDCVSKQSAPDVLSSNIFSVEYLLSECTSGRRAELLSVFGEVAGVFVNSEFWSLSVNRERPSKYDGSLCLFLPALLTFSLYFVSFFLHINVNKSFAQPSHGSNGSADLDGVFSGTRRKAV